MNQSKEMARIAYHALSDKKGEDIKVIDITGISVLADYFIIANGNSDSQVNALVDNVEEELHKAGYSLRQREGQASGSWVLLDFGDIIVHVFDKENRLFYDLERIWKDGKDITPEELEK
ncbi:MAG TPA: ribosome silencing factor [Candidatus Mediterraneibacter stercorigallinarum]|uniref:Ribosomal silencing factor RsfS n=1 Tax=Candidatus Mediterraneibacter stercorigallinarum TaxID=2838686 RepID=A0A9D2DAI9_9FIRM|nr:ribosome silencing factor [Candidatus Mediterraneibacter stercorigallinarum]